MHRLSYDYFKGGKPEVVMHTCDTPACWNPDHLIGGTHKQNHHDKMRKARQARKLDDKDVTEIRRLYTTRKYTQKQLGRMFGVHQVHISSIVRFSRREVLYNG